jgi:hypothetical protein
VYINTLSRKSVKLKSTIVTMLCSFQIMFDNFWVWKSKLP